MYGITNTPAEPSSRVCIVCQLEKKIQEFYGKVCLICLNEKSKEAFALFEASKNDEMQ
jgi:hypothetical protein